MCKTNKCGIIWIDNGAFQVVLAVKNPPNAGDARDSGSVPGSGRSPGGGRGNSLWHSCLENLMNRRAPLSAVHRVAKSQTGNEAT